MLKKAAITGDVDGREKHLYSIYKKMQMKHISLNEMVDVYGFRIIVDSADTCYRALGLVHSVYKPMPGRFKDYIAIPRVNGYQSLHTTLFGPNGVPIEAPHCGGAACGPACTVRATTSVPVDPATPMA